MDQAQYAFTKDTTYQIALTSGQIVQGTTHIIGPWALELVDVVGNHVLIPYHAISVAARIDPPGIVREARRG